MKLKRHKQFTKDLRKIKFTDEQFQKFIKYINLLLEGKNLPPESKDHPLLGKWKGFREFHLGGDLLVIHYRTEDELVLARIGSHNQLFKKI